MTQPRSGRLAFDDWEADALTPDGRSVSDRLGRRDVGAMLVSQGSLAQPPGAGGAGSMPRDRAVKLTRRRGWTVVEARSSPSGASQDSSPQFFVLRGRPALSRADMTEAYSSIDIRGDPDIVLHCTPHGVMAFQRLTADVAHHGAAVS